MSPTATATKQVLDQARQSIAKKSPKREEKEAPSISTQTNVFARIMLNDKTTPEEKKAELVKALTFSKEATREENRAKLETFSQFREYLQEQRKLLNREGIELQDTEAFVELQSAIDEMTRESVAFQDDVKPLLDVLNSVFKIRQQDKITDVYREIESDKVWQEEQRQILTGLKAELQSTTMRFEDLAKEKIRLENDKSFFGFGPIKAEARTRLAQIEKLDIPDLTSTMDTLNRKIGEQQVVIEKGPHTDNPDLAEQKKVLREFLDLTKDGSRERQKKLIDSAVRYVDTSDNRLKSVLNTLGRLGKHAETMSDMNGTLRGMHAVMDEGLKEVIHKNDEIKGELAQAPEAESPIAKMTREEKLAEVTEHMITTNDGAIDIANSIGGLTKHSVQIQSYKDTLRNESNSTKRLHLEGVSQMGEQLMSVISAISAAATTESRSIAASNFAKMAEQNQAIITQEVIRNATAVDIEAGRIAKLVGELETMGEVLDTSNDITRQGYDNMRGTVAAIRKVANVVQQSVQDLVSQHAGADVATESNGKDVKAEPETTKFANPFDRLRK